MILALLLLDIYPCLNSTTAINLPCGQLATAMLTRDS